MSNQKMRGAEAAWLSLDEPNNLMTTTVALHLGGPLGIEALAGAAERRLCARFPRLRRRARRRRPRWEDDLDFRVDRHVRRHPGGAGAEALIGDAISRPLPLTRPPWRIELIEEEGLLIASFHRCLVDSHAALRLLLLLADDPAAAAAALRPEAAGPKALSPLLSVSPEPRSPLRGPLGPAKRAARSAPLPLARAERAARALGLTTAAALLAAVTGALRGFLEARGGGPGELGLAVDMDRHLPGAEPEPSARTGLLRLGLAVGEAEPTAWLDALRRQGLGRGAAPPTALDLSLLSDRGWLPRAADALALRFVGSRSAASLVDLLGPARPLTIGGVPLRDIGVFPPRLSGQSLGLALVRYGGAVSLSVASDAELIPDPTEITGGFITAFEALRGVLPGGWGAETSEGAAAGDSAGGDAICEDETREGGADDALGDGAASEDEASDGAASEDEASDGAATEDEVSEDEAGDSAIGKDEVSEDKAGDSAIGESEAGESEAGDSAIGEDGAGEDEAGESEAGESEAGENEAGDGAAGESEAGDGAAGEGPFGEPQRPADRCAATTRAGRPCKNRPLEGGRYCRVHSNPAPEGEPGRCAATTKAGRRCKNRAAPGAAYCGRHRGGQA